jgi:hypothetical protein
VLDCADELPDPDGPALAVVDELVAPEPLAPD